MIMIYYTNTALSLYCDGFVKHTHIYVSMCVCVCVCVWLVGFYGMSTSVGYLMPNPFLCKSVLFKTIQYAVSSI